MITAEAIMMAFKQASIGDPIVFGKGPYHEGLILWKTKKDSAYWASSWEKAKNCGRKMDRERAEWCTKVSRTLLVDEQIDDNLLWD